MMIDKKVKCRDVIGRLVRITRDITTVGGDAHQAGTVFKVFQTHRGRFSMSRPNAAQNTGTLRAIRRGDLDFVDIPECGFWEDPDCAIVWGAEDGVDRCAPDGEPIVVEYHQAESGGWVPFHTWVRTADGSIDMYDCDWLDHCGRYCYHDAGGGQPYVNKYAEPDAMPARLWVTDGVHVVDGWGERDDDGEAQPLTDVDLLAMGIRRIHGPTPTPFIGGEDTDTFHCETCGLRFPDGESMFCRLCGNQVHDEHIKADEWPEPDDFACRRCRTQGDA